MVLRRLASRHEPGDSYHRSGGPVMRDPFDRLRHRWAAILVGDGVDPHDPYFRTGLDTLSRQARTVELAHGSSADMRESFQQLRVMAAAYRTPGTVQFGDETFADKIVDGLDRLHD